MADETPMPPLPEVPEFRFAGVAARTFTADDMHAYARQHAAELTELLRQRIKAAPVPARVADVGADSARLDFVLANMAWIEERRADSGARTFILMTQDSDERFVELSDWCSSPRAAIDNAMQRRQRGK
jgi:hypothetical protein